MHQLSARHLVSCPPRPRGHFLLADRVVISVAMEQRLSNVLADFARTLTTDFPIQGILDHLVVTIVEVLPIDAAGVTLIAPGSSPHFIAASDDSALCFEELQTELWEGPCLAAYETGEAVAIPDLTRAAAFPRFARRATEAGSSSTPSWAWPTGWT